MGDSIATSPSSAAAGRLRDRGVVPFRRGGGRCGRRPGRHRDGLGVDHFGPAVPAPDGDLLFLVAQVELGEVVLDHELDEFLELADIDHVSWKDSCVPAR
jgi:hypothetical protein